MRDQVYRCKYLPHHPCSDVRGLIKEHRLIASNAVNGNLSSDHPIHHHSMSELVICESIGYHKLLHARSRAYYSTGDPRKRKCPLCKEYDNVENMQKRSGGPEAYWHRDCHTQYMKGYHKENKDSRRFSNAASQWEE